MPVKNRPIRRYPGLVANPEITVKEEKPKIPKRIVYFLPKRSDIKPAMIGVNIYPQREAAPITPRPVLSV
jgi:hypothetical protein